MSDARKEGRGAFFPCRLVDGCSDHFHHLQWTTEQPPKVVKMVRKNGPFFLATISSPKDSNEYGKIVVIFSVKIGRSSYSRRALPRRPPRHEFALHGSRSEVQVYRFVFQLMESSSIDYLWSTVPEVPPVESGIYKKNTQVGGYDLLRPLGRGQ